MCKAKNFLYNQFEKYFSVSGQNSPGQNSPMKADKEVPHKITQNKNQNDWKNNQQAIKKQNLRSKLLNALIWIRI